MHTFTFNTGRKYARDGQPIVVRVLDDRTVLFADLARCIDGRLEEPLPRFRNPTDNDAIARLVLHEYDHNRYEHDPRARELFRVDVQESQA